MIKYNHLMIYNYYIKRHFPLQKQMSPSDFAASCVKAALQCQRLMRWELFSVAMTCGAPSWPLVRTGPVLTVWECEAPCVDAGQIQAALLMTAALLLLLQPQYRCVAPPHRAWGLQTESCSHWLYVFFIFSVKFKFFLDLEILSIYSGERKVYCRTISCVQWSQPLTHEAWPQPVFHHPHSCLLCQGGNNVLLHKCPGRINTFGLWLSWTFCIGENSHIP